MDLFKSIELANLYNQAPTEHLEKAIRARHPESGRWVTLNGGTSNETGEHHGVHVFVEGGKITKGPKNLVGKEPEKAPEPHEMSHAEFRGANKGLHPETARVAWLNSVIQHVRKGGQISDHVHKAEPWLKPYIDNGFKNPKSPQPKRAGEGMPFQKVQSERNNAFLRAASGSFFHMTEEHHEKDLRKILHEKGYDAALDHIRRWGSRHTPIHDEELRRLAEEDKNRGNGLAPGQKTPEKEPEKAPEPPKEEPKKKAARKPRQKDHMKEADALRDESDRLNAQGHMSDHDHYISRDHHRQIDMYNKRHRLAIDPEDQEYAGKSRDNEIQKLHEHVAKSRKFNDKITAAQKETLLRVKNAHKVPEFAKVYHEDIKNGMAHVEALNKHLHASDRVDKHKVEDHLNELARINMRLKKHRKNYM